LFQGGAAVTPLAVETAAIRIGEAVFTLPRPNRHHNIMWWLSALGINSGQMHDQGFVLSNGAYADRQLALKVALDAAQVWTPAAPPNLYSEDLWDGGFDMPLPAEIKALTLPTGRNTEQSDLARDTVIPPHNTPLSGGGET
jgi:hypothetical protein